MEEQQLEMAQQASSDGSAAGAIFGLIFMALYLGAIVAMIAGTWKVFEKAGRTGWHSLIPIYNMVVGAQIAGKSGWWVVLMCIPGVSLVLGILWGQAMAKVFGKGAGFGLGLTFLSPIFLPILGFGDAEYAADAPSSSQGQPMRRAA